MEFPRHGSGASDLGFPEGQTWSAYLENANFQKFFQICNSKGLDKKKKEIPKGGGGGGC